MLSLCQQAFTNTDMANERITEGIVRDHFKNDALFGSIKFEEQKSSIKRIIELLKGQSKNGGSGDGKPEFIISFPTNLNYIIVVECKAEPRAHESKERNIPKDYAVDGVLHYAKALKEDFNVLAIAVSGQNETELVVSHFYWKKNGKDYSELSDKRLLAIDDYLQVFEDQFFISDFYTRDIAYKARYLNEEFQAYTIPEYKRCTMISAMLLALINKDFKDTYAKITTTKELGKSMLAAINAVFESETDIVRSKTVILREFENILNEPLFVQETIKHKDHKEADKTLSVAKEIILYLQKNVYPLVEHSNIGYDVLGRFYIEFIRYAGSEQKSGLVLTPAHITELFCDLAQLRLTDIVYDPCCGTGGFLVAAMQRLFKLAGNDTQIREHIRKHQLCGCELRSDMFSYACSSMRFRGDGKSNLYNGSCFNNENSIASVHKPTVAFLNPPYDVGNARQMEFIEHALNVLDKKAYGRVVAIVQMSCAIKEEKELLAVKKRLLAKHHLKAVMTMPDDLFYPIGVVTCVMVFEANIPNKGRKTWFGYFKDDGFEKKKHLGRIDAKNRYASIKEKWLSAYNELEEIDGLSVKHEITANDEWCAEAYLNTDYSVLSERHFERKMNDFLAFDIAERIKGPIGEQIPSFLTLSDLKQPFSVLPQSTECKLETKNWKPFRYDDIFKIEKGFYNKKPETHAGQDIPFIGATDSNNGITERYGLSDIEDASKTGDDPNQPLTQKLFSPNCITVSNNGSIGYAFYQTRQFTCTHDVNPLYLKNHQLNKYLAMFLCTLIELDRYRWAYGRKWRPKRMPSSIIKLPVRTDGTPNWDMMENYIKRLPYSALL